MLLPRLVRERPAQSAGEVHQAPPFIKMTQLELVAVVVAERKYNPGGEPSRQTAPRLEASAVSSTVRGKGGDVPQTSASMPSSTTAVIMLLFSMHFFWFCQSECGITVELL